MTLRNLKPAPLQAGARGWRVRAAATVALGVAVCLSGTERADDQERTPSPSPLASVAPTTPSPSTRATNRLGPAAIPPSPATNLAAAPTNATGVTTNLPAPTTNAVSVATNVSARPTNPLPRPSPRLANPRGLPLNRAEALARARAQATNAPAPSARGWERRLYVAGRSGLSVHDIDAGHKFLRRVDLPGDYTGIGASVTWGKLYLASRTSDELICLDLTTETVTWRRRYGPGPGSLALTPDGTTIYLPCRGDGDWWVLNAATGDVITKVSVGRGSPPRENPGADYGPFHTWCNRSGTRMYLSVLSVPDVFLADLFTHQVVGAIGDFSKSVSAFAVSADERHVFACVEGLLGFEVGETRTGRVISRLESRPPDRLRQLRAPPARPPPPAPAQAIALHPNQRELWLADHTHGYLYVYDVSRLPARPIASVPLFEKPEDQPKPGWITFGIDGRYAYVGGIGAIDAAARRLAVRFPASDTVLEVNFWAGRPHRAGQR